MTHGHVLAGLGLSVATVGELLRTVGYSPPDPILVTGNRLNSPFLDCFRILLEVPKELLLRRRAGEKSGLGDGVRSM